MKPTDPGKGAHPVLLREGGEGGWERYKKKSLPEVPGSVCFVLFCSCNRFCFFVFLCLFFSGGVGVFVFFLLLLFLKKSYRTWFSFQNHQQVDNYA